ncbi:IS1 family transposase [Methanocaldococcus infernus]|uniref:IS1 family transposase n=1 Tax=Methanocaldococcus infernus TaxID=67760 RepID=UPI0012F651F6|nr:IS1 family transposase [Methanocaldococcus infernus]
MLKKLNNANRKIKLNMNQIHLEIDEMHSFVRSKDNKVWIWIAVDKNTGLIIAHKTGDRSDKSLKKLLKEIPKKVLDKCTFYTDKWKAYNILPNERHKIGKEYTRRVERTFLTFRNSCARLVRRGIRYSKSMEMHNIIIDLLVYFYNKDIISKFGT